MNNDKIYKLIEALKKMPNMGTKNAQRYAYWIAGKLKKDVVNDLIVALSEVGRLNKCEFCSQFVYEENLCEDCKNKKQFNKVIVIEEYYYEDVFLKFTDFKTKLFVLDIANSTTEEKINSILKLSNWIKLNLVNEVILALNPNLEGELNSNLIKGYLSTNNVRISKISIGVPLGSSIDYIDYRTLEEAIKKRNQFN